MEKPMQEQYTPPLSEVMEMASEGAVLTDSRTGGNNEGWGYETL